MKYYVYVLKSQKNQKRYVGFTRKDPKFRLKEHNAKGSDWTSRNGPFSLLHAEKFNSRKDALNREKYLKSGAGRKWLDNEIDF